LVSGKKQRIILGKKGTPISTETKNKLIIVMQSKFACPQQEKKKWPENFFSCLKKVLPSSLIKSKQIFAKFSSLENMEQMLLLFHRTVVE